MPLPTIPSGNVASAIGGGYEVANSCMFNNDDGAYMHKTPGSAGNLRTWTFSAWVKKCTNGVDNYLLSSYVDANNTVNVWFNSDDVLECQIKASGNNYKLSTNRVFRDVSAWINIIFAVDTTESTEGDRFKIWINGTRETSFATDNYPALNTDGVLNDTTQMNIGKYDSGTTYFDGYMAEVCLVDGSQLAATSFGEFDDDTPTIWKPIDVSGLTFGTNGFYCDYEDSANLGNDANGGTDLTEVNLAAADQATDTPTNNFCTLNPLSKDEMTFAEGNCKVTQASDDGGGSRTDDNARGTIGVSSGKWYWEVKCTGGSTPVVVGICFDELKMGSDLSGSTGVYAIQNASATNAYKRENGTTAETSGFTNPAVNDIINVALDMDNGKLYIGINGTYENQAGSTGNPASGSNETFSSISTNYFWLPWIESRGDNQVAECNFGGCPVFSISSGNADANGYGNFEYAVPSGYLALCTKNLGSDGG